MLQDTAEQFAAEPFQARSIQKLLSIVSLHDALYNFHFDSTKTKNKNPKQTKKTPPKPKSKSKNKGWKFEKDTTPQNLQCIPGTEYIVQWEDSEAQRLETEYKFSLSLQYISQFYLLLLQTEKFIS